MRYEEPWIIVGEEDPDVLTLRAEGVRWATDALRREYRFKDPDGIWTIWLFSGNDSYTRQALALFGDTPQTPYGYASSDHRALIMDISTGGGTLVHEMVHPMLHASMPTVPAWFNEGLASLYEQVREVDGRIYGDVNWRLGGVQESIRAGVLPSFGWLMRLDHDNHLTVERQCDACAVPLGDGNGRILTCCGRDLFDFVARHLAARDTCPDQRDFNL